jgi:hypothetical protein
MKTTEAASAVSLRPLKSLRRGLDTVTFLGGQRICKTCFKERWVMHFISEVTADTDTIEIPIFYVSVVSTVEIISAVSLNSRKFIAY